MFAIIGTDEQGRIITSELNPNIPEDARLIEDYKLENNLDKETHMKLQGFDITFTPGGWGVKPVVDGITLCKSFSTEEQAVDWLKGRKIRFERKFSAASIAYDNMSDDPPMPDDDDDFEYIDGDLD